MTAASTLRDELARRIAGDISTDERELERAATNFGRLRHEKPAVVVRASNEEDIAHVLEFATSNGIPVTCRGSAHSQDRQNLTRDGIVLDTSSFSGVIEFDPEREHVVMWGGTQWSQAVAHTAPQGWCPRVLTAVADTTVAGTLSVAGIGGTSHRFGAQVNNVVWMDVITPNGSLVRCSATENRELFDCVRAGIGQFGVISRACFPVRRSGKFVTIVTAIYDDAEQLFSEALAVVKSDLVDQIDGGLFPFEGKHELLVHYGVESDHDSPDAARRVTDAIGTSRVRLTRTVPFWNESGPTDHFFVAGMAERFAPPGTVRPFVDQAVSVDLACRMFKHLRGSFSGLLEVAHIAILFGNARFGHPAPLWRLPDADPIVGVGASPFFPEADREAGASLMVSFGQYWQKRGAKRYVAGYLGFDAVRHWAEHFGELWPWFVQMKLKYDPARIMNTRMLPDGWAESITAA